MRTLLLLTVLALSCRLKGNVESPDCVSGSSVCRDGRPYVCGGGYLRPVGNVPCARAHEGAVCCYSAEDRVHACVTVDHCSPEPTAAADAGVSHD